MTQLEKLKKLLRRKKGATSMEIIQGIGTVSPGKRVSELRALGLTILKVQVAGKNYFRYFLKEQSNGKCE
jgi:hypothetical protein